MTEREYLRALRIASDVLRAVRVPSPETAMEGYVAACARWSMPVDGGAGALDPSFDEGATVRPSKKR